MQDDKLIAFLADTLALWEINGEVRAGHSVAAEVNASSGALIWIERAPKELPFRWLVRWRVAGEAPGGVREQRPKACSSLVGVLAAMREALNVERGSAVRIVPAPVEG